MKPIKCEHYLPFRARFCLLNKKNCATLDASEGIDNGFTRRLSSSEISAYTPIQLQLGLPPYTRKIAECTEYRVSPYSCSCNKSSLRERKSLFLSHDLCCCCLSSNLDCQCAKCLRLRQRARNTVRR